MKATVVVRLKRDVLDPEGEAIAEALSRIGFEGVTGVRAGKVFEIALEDGTSREDAKEKLEKMAVSLLANPVTEDAEIRFEE